MPSPKQVEDASLKEAIEGYEKRLETGDTSVEIVQPCADLDEVLRRTQEAAQLGGSSMMRLGERFLKETDRKLS